MKQLVDFLPLVVFFVFYKIYDIFVASAALVVATVFALIFTWMKYRQVEKMALISALMVVIFGSLTFAFQSDLFIKWKVTVIYILFSVILLVSQLILKKSLIQQILGKELILPNRVWSKLNLSWALFFLICGVINLYVAFWLPQEVWVNFKVFGLTLLTLLFTVISGIYIYRHMPKK
ncbi:putative membrane protein invovled in intracellular septation [Candidatus Regiella insecticola LSR1]|uniref:Inner membrane-spanning protein YciB n=1 Tax=Candidatus Regiella insecticola LSR1 TaxID=663321 RepID=E0WRR3_9ENTR|nr:septation protein A [Candidatus Regiella insecticola]EFL92287.1 putative membrane protein invovled in intracellular septation [Candidatus Regiella insecticola LSR1]